MKRKYDIGQGCIITDDGYSIRAECKKSTYTESIGVQRPRVAPIPEETRAQFSTCGRYFYLVDFTDGKGFWLGTKAWDSKEEMEAQMKAGLFGKQSVQITLDGGKVYYRELLPFVSWKVNAERDYKDVSTSEDMVKDYLSLALSRERENERRFDEAIAYTGRTLKWIMDRIGAWVPEPPEPPPTVLQD